MDIDNIRKMELLIRQQLADYPIPVVLNSNHHPDRWHEVTVRFLGYVTPKHKGKALKKIGRHLPAHATIRIEHVDHHYDLRALAREVTDRTENAREVLADALMELGAMPDPPGWLRRENTRSWYDHQTERWARDFFPPNLLEVNPPKGVFINGDWFAEEVQILNLQSNDRPVSLARHGIVGYTKGKPTVSFEFEYVPGTITTRAGRSDWFLHSLRQQVEDRRSMPKYDVVLVTDARDIEAVCVVTDWANNQKSGELLITTRVSMVGDVKVSP